MSLFRYGADNVALVTVNPNDQGEHVRSIDGAVMVSLDHQAQSLVTRLLAGVTTADHTLWLDLQDANNLYLLEAPDGADDSDTSFVGVRLPRDLVGAVSVNHGGTLSFQNRKTDGGWR